MSKETHRFDDRRMDIIMGRLLQLGVVLASATVLLGGVLYVRSHAGAVIHYGTFVRTPVTLHPLELLRRIASGNAAAIIELGVLLLIATPIARVAFAVVGFGLERDRLYVAISVLVLCVLLFGLLHGS